jgi:sulfide dehydrogenase cytochrome subunit
MKPHGKTTGRIGVRCIAVAATVAAFALGVAKADDYSDARMLASQCAQCHGTDGVSVGGIDSLAGAEYRDLRDKMFDMNRPGETGDIMKHQAKGYTRAQIELIAWFYSSLPKAGEDD